jgi:uncharacterized protein (TIGR02996 family)
MDTGAQLYQAVLAEPFDDAPRLIYADWLEEQGEAERARFIRDQVKYNNGHSVKHRVSYGRTAQLADAKPWNTKFDRVTTPSIVHVHNFGRSSVVFRRGFPAKVITTSYEFWTKGAHRIVLDHPIVEIDLEEFRVAESIGHNGQSLYYCRPEAYGPITNTFAKMPMPGPCKNCVEMEIAICQTLANMARKMNNLPLLTFPKDS